MMNQLNVTDLQALADAAWSEAEDLLARLVGSSELFGHQARWDGAWIGSDLA